MTSFAGSQPTSAAIRPSDRRALSFEQWLGIVREAAATFGSGAAQPRARRRRGSPVTMTFEEFEPGRTCVTITEEGWRRSEAGLKSSYSNCEGWTGMLCALKGYLEHGFNLREGFYA